jgi:S1-C subfamily serine protease
VVQIRTDSGEGSGIVLDTHGNVVTNAHVVQGTGSLTVITSDGRQHKASLVGTYSQNDLAVVRVGDTGGLKPAGFADSSQVKVGDIVLAVGSPFGLADTVTEGIVSATGRTQSEQNGVTLVDLIQTSAGINPGNSGGALVDINGKVIGIPTLSSVDAPQRGQPSENIGFAIPGKQVQDISSQLITKGTVAHTGRAYLGISSRSDPNGGVRVVSTVANGPAAAAGIQAGSVITDLGGHPVADSNSLSQALAAYKPGDVVEVTLTLPDGSTQVVSVKVGERPTTP